MRHHKKSWSYRYGGILAIGIAIIIIIILITILTTGKDEVEDNNDSYRMNETDLDTLVKKNNTDNESISEPIGTPVKENETVNKRGLCEDYFFEEGDELEIAGHTMFVERIASSSIRLVVDGEKHVFGEGDAERLGDGIRVELQKNNIAHFGTGDPNNAVSLRIGCNNDEDPVSKLMKKEGRKVCQALYEQCEASFEYGSD
ncbi:MAG: hypothetical protein ACLFTH_01810 [Candidatus Woesearchaeota archaeon]